MPKSTQLTSVAVVGAGNIGSQLLPLIARNRKIGRIVVIDPDCYDETNLDGQNILRRHVGMGKTAVQSKAIQAINADLQVSCEAVEVGDVALGVLRVDLIVSCVDNRAARQDINQMAWHSGVPWLDTAVDADNQFCRINLYVPGADSPCLECQWTEEEYAQIEVSHSCSGERLKAPAATAAPAELGAAAAALGAGQVRRVLNGDTSLAGKQVFIDLKHFGLNVAKMPLNQRCRFEHATWRIESIGESPDRLSLADALHHCCTDDESDREDVALRQEGQTFVTRLTCAACGATSNRFLRLSGRLKPWQRRCHRCGGERIATGFDQSPELKPSNIPAAWLQKPLSELGYGAADVFSVARGGQIRHFELGVTDG